MTDSKFTRRDFLKATIASSSALVAPTIINYLGQSSPSSDKEFLEVRDGSFYMGGEEYMIKGANYITRDHPWRMFEEYDPEQIDTELEIASELGVNTVRVPISFPQATGLGPDCRPLDNIKVQEVYFDNFRNFLDTAESHQIKVIPIALDHVWNEALFLPRNFEITKDLLESWLPEFVDDERILAWDAQNEPEVKKRNFEKRNLGDDYNIREYSRMIATVIRDIDKNHPVTIGLQDTLSPEGGPELITDLEKYIEYEDFYTFHHYPHPKHLAEAIEKIREKTNKPIFLGEFGQPTTGVNKWHTEKFQKKYYEMIFGEVAQKNLSGVMFWKLTDHSEESLDRNPYAPKNDYADDFGILRTDYSKKPAARVVEQYYKWIL